MKYSHVFWDWNGTLLNDCGQCVTIVNRMLKNRGIKELNGINDYRSVFDFPVANYYKTVGFDFAKEPFEDLAVEYMSSYNGLADWILHEGALQTLNKLSELGLKQIILSAAKLEDLTELANKLGVACYFDQILGVKDIYGSGKLDLAKDFINANHIDKAAFVGDTIHDYQVAKAIGADPILFSGGHQSRERLLTCGVPVIENLEELIPLINV